MEKMGDVDDMEMWDMMKNIDEAKCFPLRDGKSGL